MYPPFHRLIMKIARMKIRTVQGKEYLPTDGGFIVVANHPNWLDPLFLGAVLFEATGRHFRFLASSARHRWTQAIIAVDRHDPNGSYVQALEYLQNGEVIGSFPFPNGNTATENPKTGAVRLSIETGRPIIPARIEGFGNGHVWQSIWKFCTSRKPVRIAFGKPVYVSALQNGDALRSFSQQLHAIINEMQHV